jgi:FkbM family methyltransferase
MMNNFRWILDNHNDGIQEVLLSGKFFEEEILKSIQQYCPIGANILDIGAHIGNHTVYFSKFYNVGTVYPIEPIPRFYKMLLANVALNYCHNVNLDYIGVALGNRQCLGYPLIPFGENNLGATRLYPEPMKTDPKNTFEPVNIVKGDDLFGGIDIHFIKIDVEHMEMIVIQGLQETIDRCRPNIFIEVASENREEFNQWINTNNYMIVQEYNHVIYGSDNFMIIPIE